jgi:hypothetical protein
VNFTGVELDKPTVCFSHDPANIRRINGFR